jgi:hypothetical protein
LDSNATLRTILRDGSEPAEVREAGRTLLDWYARGGFVPDALRPNPRSAFPIAHWAADVRSERDIELLRAAWDYVLS